jgi:hypothetical protein
MTFRRRLTIFFLLIVVLPMIALAVAVTELSGESRTGKADARLAAGLGAARSLQEAEFDRSAHAARELAREDALASALRTGAEDRIRAVTRRLHSEHELSSLSVHPTAASSRRPDPTSRSPRARSRSAPATGRWARFAPPRSRPISTPIGCGSAPARTRRC